MALDAEVLQLDGEISAVVLWVVTQGVLPSVAPVACDGHAIVVHVPTDAADLTIIVLRRVDGVRGGHGVSVGRSEGERVG